VVSFLVRYSAPQVLAADKGYWQDAFTRERLGWQIDLVCIAKKGKCTAEERAYERSLPFRLAQGFRAGAEGSISFLKRVFGLWRCMNKGFDHFVSTVASAPMAATVGAAITMSPSQLGNRTARWRAPVSTMSRLCGVHPTSPPALPSA
jgi:hypothetical protein